jgi:uncharacterized protein YbaR (Trm112 family)
MAVHEKLLEVLVCPACKGELTQVRWQEGDDIVDDDDSEAPLLALDCMACRLRFPIEGGIPVMLVDQAKRI